MGKAVKTLESPETGAPLGEEATVVAEVAPEQVEVVKADIIVCAYPGDEEVVAAVWRKMLRSGNLLIRTVDPDEQITATLADLVADENVADVFTFIPATIIPCSSIDANELSIPYVYVNAANEWDFAGRVPMTFCKNDMILMFAEDPAGEMDDAAFLKAYMGKFRTRPVEVGFRFGNFITPVLRANPCENVVIEAFVRKKFVSANEDGFKAISSLVRNTLLK